MEAREWALEGFGIELEMYNMTSVQMEEKLHLYRRIWGVLWEMRQLRRYRKPNYRFCTDEFIKNLENNENPSVQLGEIAISYRR